MQVDFIFHFLQKNALFIWKVVNLEMKFNDRDEMILKWPPNQSTKYDRRFESESTLCYAKTKLESVSLDSITPRLPRVQ